MNVQKNVGYFIIMEIYQKHKILTHSYWSMKLDANSRWLCQKASDGELSSCEKPSHTLCTNQHQLDV